MLEKLQLICCEVIDVCNLAEEHSSFCPAAKQERYIRGTPARNSDFIDFIDFCIDNGFKGSVGFHYYCEPTLYIDRCKRISKEMHKRDIKTVMWTNGTSNDDLSCFDSIYKTKYPQSTGYCSKSIPYTPDDRIKIYDADPINQSEYRPCFRPSHIEMPIDFYGDVHMCCGDWMRKIVIGNIRGNFDIILAHWSSAIKSAEYGNELCLKCQGLKNGPAVFDSTYIV